MATRGRNKIQQCQQCQKDFLPRRPSLPQKFCSAECSAAHFTISRSSARDFKPIKPRTGDHVTCDSCGSEFYRMPGEIRRDRRFCSVKCARVPTKTKIAKTCGYCQKEFLVYPSYTSQRYCSKPCESDAKIKNPTGRMHNGRPVRQEVAGYILLWEPNHPIAQTQGNWYPEHRIVMERELGRQLEPFEHVHHINHVKDDNRPENLMVVTSKEHSEIHMRSLHKRVRELGAELDRYRTLYGPLPQEA